MIKRHYFISRLEAHKVVHKNDTPILRSLALTLAELEFEREYSFIYDKAGSRYRLDFAQLDEKVNIEFDGAGHDTPWHRAMDPKRDARLIACGWRVMRIVNTPKPTATVGACWSFVWVANGQPTPFCRRLQAILEPLFA